VEPTGTVARGDVAFVPQGGRVDALRADVGDFVAPGMPILDLTGTAQVVSLEADVDDRDRFEVDTEVTVVLPGGDGYDGARRVVNAAIDHRPAPSRTSASAPAMSKRSKRAPAKPCVGNLTQNAATRNSIV
jgi:hypothetical protein